MPDSSFPILGSNPEIEAQVETAVHNPLRLNALRRSRLLDTPPEPAFDRLTRLAARLLNAPVGLVTLVDEHRQFFLSSHGLPDALASERETPLAYSFCKYVVAANDPMVVDDSRLHPMVWNNPATTERNTLAYLGVPLLDPDGYPLGSVCVADTQPRKWTDDELQALRDLGELAARELIVRQCLRDRNQFAERVVEISPVVSYLLDVAQQRILHITANVRTALGYSAEQIEQLGSALLPMLMHPDDRGRFPEQMEMLRNLAPGESAAFQYRLRHADGSWRWFYGRDIVYEREQDGTPRQMLGSALDITEQRQAQEIAKRAEDHLHLVLQEARLGTWSVDLTSGRMECSEGCKVNFGLAPDAVFDHYEQVRAAIHPEDREMQASHLEQALREGREYSSDYRVIWPDGSVHWILARGTASYDRDGIPYLISGITVDVTERKMLEAARRESDALNRSILESSVDCIKLINFDGQLLFMNGNGLKLMEVESFEEIAKANWLSLWTDETRSAVEDAFNAVRSGGQGRFQGQCATGKGTLKWWDVILSPVPGANDKPMQILGVSRDITAIKQAEEALRDADHRKNEFLAMLAHELRNPLAAICNTLKVWEPGKSSMDLSTWAKGVLDRQSTQLTRLVEDLLDVSRITRGKVDLRKERLHIGPVLDRAVEAVRPILSERQHDLTTAYDPDDDLVAEADPARLEQIVGNLLSNAAKYTDPGGHIWLEARRVDSQLVITVRDTGVGMPPEKLPQMFELFVQGERTLARSEGGLGLGLTIVRTLTEMHGGTVSAASEGVGKGSKFIVKLPALDTYKIASSAEVPSEMKSPHSRRVLVVDDHTDGAEAMGRLLKRKGHEVEIAFDGNTAIERARLFRPDVILLDLGMPGMDGYEVARALRDDPSSGSALLIAVSGYGQEEDRRRTKEAGFDHHFVKPVDHAHLDRLLQAGIAMH